MSAATQPSDSTVVFSSEGVYTTGPNDRRPAARYCQKCRLIFAARRCLADHPPFQYTESIPEGAEWQADGPPPSAINRPLAKDVEGVSNPHRDRLEALFAQVEGGDVEAVRQELAGGLVDVNSPSDLRMGESMLHLAREPAMVAALLDANADINLGAARSSMGALSQPWWTPLWAAVRHGREDVALSLLERGADAKAAITEGELAGKSVLAAVCSGSRLNGPQRAAVAAALIEANADVDAKEIASGHSVLHQASLNDDVAVAELLIQRGAAVNVCTRDAGLAQSPLDIALQNRFTALAEVLRNAGGKLAAEL